MNQEDFSAKQISIAPMMDWTDRHFRYFARLISPRIHLYTEMVTTGALIHGDRERFLRFHPSEHPITLQLGGSDPADLAQSAMLGQEWGYDEINLNCGCPSDRVQSGRFGVCLMKEPGHVADCVKAMREATDIPVTVKCRIGVDHDDDFGFLDRFVDKISNAGCGTFIIHARKAWLKGLSPRENREVPPLSYERAAEIKRKYPQLRIILNGGITTTGQMLDHLGTFDGVMIGREAYHNPWILDGIEQDIYKTARVLSREDIALSMGKYASEQASLHGTPFKSVARHILGLYHGQPGGKIWRRTLSTLSFAPGADERVIEAALDNMRKSRKI